MVTCTGNGLEASRKKANTVHHIGKFLWDKLITPGESPLLAQGSPCTQAPLAKLSSSWKCKFLPWNTGPGPWTFTWFPSRSVCMWGSGGQARHGAQPRPHSGTVGDLGSTDAHHGIRREGSAQSAPLGLVLGPRVIKGNDICQWVKKGK